jgi:hypothetical protein
MSSQVHKVLAEPDGPASYGHVVNLYSVCLRIHTLAKDRPTMHLGGSVVSSPGPVVWCGVVCLAMHVAQSSRGAGGSGQEQPSVPADIVPFLVPLLSGTSRLCHG